MIRPFTCVCMLLAGGSGLYLYQTKHRALLLDREIAHTVKQTEAARERITALRAEWALLNEPERLAELNTQHLGLRSLAPTQFVALADLPSRLPAPLPPGSVILPEPSEEVAIAHPEPAPEPARGAAARLASATPVTAPATVLAMPVVRPLRTARREEPAKSDTVTSAAAITLKPPAPVQVATANPVVLAAQPSVAAPIVLAPPTQIASASPTFRPAATVQPVSARTPIVLAQPRLVLSAALPGRSSLPHPLSPVAPGTVGEAVQRASQLGVTHASAMAAPTPYTGQ